MSGLPGNFDFKRYLSPTAHKARRKRISGPVSFPLFRAMQRLRCSGVITSVIQSPFFPDVPDQP